MSHDLGRRPGRGLLGVVFDYDPATGALFRVESVGQKDVCYAGSGSLALCDDPNPVWLQCPP